MVVLGLWVYTTFNKGNAFTRFDYDFGYWPPSIFSYPFGFMGNYSDGNSTVEPYIVGHHFIGKCIGFVKSCINP